MGFRNPITNLSADQITPGSFPPGVMLPPDQVAPGELGPDVYARRVTAGAIDGMVITGSTLRTAASPGRRLQIDNTDRDRLKFYSGDAAEIQNGFVMVEVFTPEGGALARLGRIVLQPPMVRVPVGEPVGITIASDALNGATAGTVGIVAPGGTWLRGPLFAQDVDAGTVRASAVYANGIKFAQGTAVLGLDAAGRGNVQFPTGTFPNTCTGVLAVNGDAAAAPTFVAAQIRSITASSFRISAVNGNGDGIGPWVVRVNWLAWGY